MIEVNGNPMEWSEGMTIESLLKQKNFVFSKIVVKVNDTFIPLNYYSVTIVNNGDTVLALHMMAGG